jgi:hypothetical protein
MRTASILVTGSRVRAEVAGRGGRNILGEALDQRIVEAHLLAHALHDRGVDGRAAVLVHARDEAARQDGEEQEDERHDGEQRRDDVGESAAEDKEHCGDSRGPSAPLAMTATVSSRAAARDPSTFFFRRYLAGELASTQMFSGY